MNVMETGIIRGAAPVGIWIPLAVKCVRRTGNMHISDCSAEFSRLAGLAAALSPSNNDELRRWELTVTAVSLRRDSKSRN
jgi:hypothetical protein